jgi:hypothetical protein
MGKPYQSELTKLAATYAWALNEDIARLSSFVRESAESNLYVTGSGGSYSAAAFVAFVTRFSGGQHGSAVTPLELSSIPHMRRSSVLIFSAGGNNSDVVAAFQSAVSREPVGLGIVCLRPDSKLARQASLYEFVQIWAHGSPAGKDGFLATNSLLAFFTVAHRMYCPGRKLPPNYENLRSLSDYSAKDAESVLSRESLVVLYGPSTKAAALDLESKMSEAALASVHITVRVIRAYFSCRFIVAIPISKKILLLHRTGCELTSFGRYRISPSDASTVGLGGDLPWLIPQVSWTLATRRH